MSRALSEKPYNLPNRFILVIEAKRLEDAADLQRLPDVSCFFGPDVVECNIKILSAPC